MVRSVPEYPFFAEMTALPFVEAIYSFGSYAADTQDARSDINLAILCPEATLEQWFELQRIASDANVLAKIELVRLDAMKPSPFQHYVSLHRVPLFVRNERDNAAISRELLGMVRHAADEAERAFAHAHDAAARGEAVKAFNGMFRLLWTFLRRCLRITGLRAYSPLAALRHASMEGWLEHREVWEQMMEDFARTTVGLPDDEIPALSARMQDYVRAVRAATNIISRDVLERGGLTETRA